MSSSTHIRLALSVMLLTAAFSIGCTPQASAPTNDADATQSTPEPEAGGSTTKSEPSSGSGTK